MDEPGAIQARLALSCLEQLKADPAQRGLWMRASQEAAARCSFGEREGNAALDLFFSWLDPLLISLGEQPEESGGTPLWAGALNLCQTLLDQGARPSRALSLDGKRGWWMLSELCWIKAMHASRPQELIGSIMERARPRMGIDGRQCSMALSVLPNAWIESWFDERSDPDRRDFFAHSLVWKILGTGELDEAGARLMRRLCPPGKPFSHILDWPLSSCNPWKWHTGARDWNQLLRRAAAEGGAEWVADLLLFLDVDSILGSRGLPESLEGPIERSDWLAWIRHCSTELGLRAEEISRRSAGARAQALLCKIQLDSMPQTARAQGGRGKAL